MRVRVLLPERFMKTPNELQVRAANIRAEVEAYYDKHKKPYGGGFVVPDKETVYSAVASKLGESVRAVEFCMTYSRSCTHEWSEGACPDCPSVDHIPW